MVARIVPLQRIPHIVAAPVCRDVVVAWRVLRDNFLGPLCPERHQKPRRALPPVGERNVQWRQDRRFVWASRHIVADVLAHVSALANTHVLRCRIHVGTVRDNQCLNDGIVAGASPHAPAGRKEWLFIVRLLFVPPAVPPSHMVQVVLSGVWQ